MGRNGLIKHYSREVITMKKLLLIVAILGCVKAYGQSTGDYQISKLKIVDSVQEIETSVISLSWMPNAKDDRYYYWCRNNVIHSTQGGIGGPLLDGHYIAFYPDKNLKEEGFFKKGLKDGEWKTWDRKGALTSSVDWDNGLVRKSTQLKLPTQFKLPFFKKKPDSTSTTKPLAKQ
jgi:antitoxin component YwqK of YwqJK toxin-antitoxin module